MKISHALNMKKAPDEAFTEYPMWRAKGMEEMAEKWSCIFLSIYSPNPELFKKELIRSVLPCGIKQLVQR
ncbi:hypothetical protein GCM10020331_014980 [Ectobacillus funiculus]